MTSLKPSSIEEKLHAATRMPQPRPEFLDSLRLRLAAQPNPSAPDPLRKPAPRRTHPVQMAAFALGLIALIVIIAFAVRLIPPQPLPAVGNPSTSTPTLEQAPASATPTLQPTIQPAPSSTPAGPWISLTPASGGPGTTVQVSGYYAGSLPVDQLQQQNYLTHADICWGGCTNGLPESALEVKWSQTDPGHFSLQFVVPSIPWLANDGVHKLQAGDYAISLMNLDPNATGCKPSAAGTKDCPVASQINTTFHLTEGYRGPECQDASNCGRMTASPAQGAPGDTIQVQGWAPLMEIIGQPFGYYLVLETKPNAIATSADLFQLATAQQAMDGSFTASFQVPQSANYGSPALTPGSYTLALQAITLGINSSTTNEKNFTPVLIAPTQFEITAAPGWAQRQRPAPLWIQPSSSLIDATVSADPSNPLRLAYCADGAIRLSEDGGQTWSSIPITAAGSATLPGDLEISPQQARCASVLLDPTHPDSFYAVFGAQSKQWGAPPIYYLGLYSTDRGQTWQVVPVTQSITQGSMDIGRFGGFVYSGNAIQALYYDTPSSDPAQPSPLKVSQTSDGGATWTPAALTCPPAGPCLRWGAAPSEIAGMG
ncbi:MAG: hypothetical protein M1281_18160, partial [Chloroflexi bacterium]|nr:hypothetical protein [Chloroflexota bacterium]